MSIPTGSAHAAGHPDPAAERAANTGLDLIGSLARIDLNGDVHYGNSPGGGARVTVEFPYQDPA